MGAHSIALCGIFVAGCGRIDFTTRVDGGGDGGGSDARDDAMTEDAAACILGPWSASTEITAASSGMPELQPALSPDGLVLVFARDNANQLSLWATTRTSVTVPFSGAVQLVSLGNSTAFPMWSPDGAKLYFWDGAQKVAPHLGNASFGDKDGSGLPATHTDGSLSDNELELFAALNQKLCHATRLSTAEPWQVDGMFEQLNLDYDTVGWPAFDDARQDLYIEFKGLAGDPARIAVMHRDGPELPFSAPSVVTEIPVNTGDPDISPDGRTLVHTMEGNLHMRSRTCQ